MVSIIKNQLLKHLSRFTKNLSVDKINISTLRGEGELKNLELDESVLTDLLDLPSWLKITNAWCNKVTIRVQWTKLKSVPICLNLDEVHVEVVTCDDLRNPSSLLSNNASSSSSSSLPGTTKYSFIHKVIDGITVNVNTAVVTFKSHTFIASLQISRIILESKSPTWQRADLRMTKIKDTDKGQLLIFKELEWQTVRIEARSTEDTELTPLRLLTNQARCRITIKKRLSDCLVMGSRLILILDDLLWVLTDSQLKAALYFVDSLTGLIEKATLLERKIKAARKLELLPEYQAQISQQGRDKIECLTPISKIFNKYDVIETSYHFFSQRIDLHLCDDPGTGRSSHPQLSDGGALQISLVKFQIDYYPYHLALADRKHWAKYKENSTPHAEWLRQSYNLFRNQFMNIIDNIDSPIKQSNNNNNNDNDEQKKSTSPLLVNDLNKNNNNHLKNIAIEQLSTLMTTCIIIRIHDFTIYKVTTSTRKPKIKEFIAGDREKLCLPDDVMILHAEFTYYYIPGKISFPLPPPKFYIQINPFKINYDIYSCLWLNSFVLNLYKSLIKNNNDNHNNNLAYFDVKLEALLPRIIFETNIIYNNQNDRPKSMHIQTSRVSITNVRTCDKSSRANLAECLNAFKMGQMFYTNNFPNNKNDYNIITDKLINHSDGNDNVNYYSNDDNDNDNDNNKNKTKIDDLILKLKKKLLTTDSKDVWCCSFEPVWADFYGIETIGINRPLCFLDPLPITLWLHTMNTSFNKPDNIHAIAYIKNLVSIQIDHYQLLFLLRELDNISEMSTFLIVDSNRILNTESGYFLFGAILPQVEATLIIPSQIIDCKDNAESIDQDTSSISDDIINKLNDKIQDKTIVELEIKNKNKEQFNIIDKIVKTQLETSLTNIKSNEFSSSINLNYELKKEETIIDNLQPTMNHSNSDELDLLNKNIKIKNKNDNTQLITNNFNVGISSMKKGFANFITSIDSALNPLPEDGSSDSVSMRSDISSDSENYVVVTFDDDNVDTTFVGLNTNNITPVEQASEVIEEIIDNNSYNDKSIDSGCKKNDIISAIKFKLYKIEVIQQSSGFSTSIKVQLSKINCKEIISIPWNEIQKKFTSSSRGWINKQQTTTNIDCNTSIKLRLSRDIKNDIKIDDIKNAKKNIDNKNNLMKLFNNNLKIKINDVDLTMSMSSLLGLIDLIEDEIIPDPLPMNVIIENTKIKLNEDRPSTNITSPGPVPINLDILNLNISRNETGIFQMNSINNNIQFDDENSLNNETDIELINLKKLTDKLQKNNNELTRRLVVFDNLSQENYKLKCNQDEFDNIKTNLNIAQNLIDDLLKEKQILQDTITILQQQLSKTNVNSGRSTWSMKR